MRPLVMTLAVAFLGSSFTASLEGVEAATPRVVLLDSIPAFCASSVAAMIGEGGEVALHECSDEVCRALDPLFYRCCGVPGASQRVCVRRDDPMNCATCGNVCGQGVNEGKPFCTSPPGTMNYRCTREPAPPRVDDALPRPDLSVTRLVFEPAEPRSGDRVRVIAEVANLGLAPAPESALFLSGLVVWRNSSHSSGEQREDEVMRVPLLLPSERSTFALDVGDFHGTAGSAFLLQALAWADREGTIDEADENNNRADVLMEGTSPS